MTIDITTTYTLGTAAMALGTAALFAAGWNAYENRIYPALLVAITGIAALAYGAMAAGIGVVTVDGQTLFVPRYVDWLLTTPLLLAYVALITDVTGERLGALVAVDGVMIVAGFLATWLTAPASYVSLAVSVVAFLGLLWQLYGPLTRAVDRDTQLVAGYYRKLRNIIGVLWLIYPLAWAAGPAGIGLMTPATTAIVIMYLDIISKVGFGLVAVNSSSLLAGADHGSVTADDTAAPADD